jgi:hypothetical protein
METVMNQASLSLSVDANLSLERHADTDTAHGDIDRVGFEIGWDHAHHGLVPPAELLLQGTPLGQGWRAGKAVFGRRTLGTQRHTRQWLTLRTWAWRQGVAFETQAVSAHYLAQIHVDRCPVTRLPLGGAAGQPDAAVVERLNVQAGYASGNLAVMSHTAERARDGVDVLQAMRSAHRAQMLQTDVHGLPAAAWWRLAVLRSFATPLPFYQAARLPLAVLPPNRVRLLNSPQGLQALLTMQFTRPGWAARTRALADLLSAHSLRHDFNLFVGALAPRVIEATTAQADMHQALEDAWLNERVQRRWTHLVLSLGEAATQALLDRATALLLCAAHTEASPPINSADTNGARLSCVSAPPSFNQVKVQFIMPNSNIAKALSSLAVRSSGRSAATPSANAATTRRCAANTFR